MIFQALQKIGFVICHQLPERSFTYFEQSPCLCARCLGIYSSSFIMLGYFFGYSVFIKKRRPARIYSRNVYFFALFLLFVLVVDAFSQYGGLYFSNITRYISGVIFGYGLSIFLTTLVADSFVKKEDTHTFSKYEMFGLAGVLVVMSVLTLTLNEYVLFGMHAVAVLGIIAVFTIANYLLLTLFLEQLNVRTSILKRLLFSVFLFACEAALLYLGHLQVQDQIVEYLTK